MERWTFRILPLRNSVFDNTDLGRNLRAASPNATFTPEEYLNTVEDITKYGMIYGKPVGILIDGECYSSCDIFSAAMQDSGAATIFGHDAKTGAGGAAVLSYNDIAEAVPAVGPKLPLNQDISFSFEQLLRGGRSLGRLIEGYGIDVDYMARPTLADLNPNRRNFDFLDYIATTLKRDGDATGRSFVYADIRPTEEVKYLAIPGQLPSFNVTFSGLDTIELYIGANLVNRTQVPYRTTRRASVVIAFRPPNTPMLTRFRIDGYAKGVKMFEANRYVRFLPSVNAFLAMRPGNASAETRYNWDFSAPNTSWAMLTNEGAAKDGWYYDTKGKVLRLGRLLQDGNTYAYVANVDSTVNLYIDMTQINSTRNRCMMDVDLTYDTEANYDILQVTATGLSASSILGADSGTPSLLLSRSGKGTVTNSYDLSRFCGRRVEISFRFVSDESVNGSGIVIRLVRFRSPRR